MPFLHSEEPYVITFFACFHIVGEVLYIGWFVFHRKSGGGPLEYIMREVPYFVFLDASTWRSGYAYSIYYISRLRESFIASHVVAHP